MKTVTIFGSSIPGEGTEVYREAQRLGRRLAEAGLAVCNGGYGGVIVTPAPPGRGGAGAHGTGFPHNL